MENYTKEFSTAKPAVKKTTDKTLKELLTGLKSYEKLFIPSGTVAVDTNGTTHTVLKDHHLTRRKFTLHTTYWDDKRGDITGCYIPRMFVKIDTYKITTI